MSARPEDTLVSEIKRILHDLGYMVAVIGQRKAKGSGTTVGFPDMAVRHRQWPECVMVGIEVKIPTGRLSPEQEGMEALGWFRVARSVEDALHIVAQYEPDTRRRINLRAAGGGP